MVAAKAHESSSQKPSPSEQQEGFCSRKCFGAGIYLHPGESEGTAQPQPSRLQLSWITTDRLPHPDLSPFAVTRDSDKKAQLSHVHRTQEYANDCHMSEMEIFSKAPHTQRQSVLQLAVRHTSGSVCKPSLPGAIRGLLTDTTRPPWY